MPPPASGLSARLVLGPALRAQSDRRLVRLVREGYESAFEEIVRRYRRPLDRFAASIVGGRSEDITQDSFRKALVALRDGDGELELRPWLYRIVRNTALNDLRDRPPAAAELTEDLVGRGRSAALEAEQREEMATLTARLLALPAKQRAALVMRELEGMGHEEIATALGVSGGAARQAIARGRATVRSGFGAFVPLPLIRALMSSGDGMSEAAIGGGGAAASGAAVSGAEAAAGRAGAAAVGAGGLGGLGAGAMKLGLATVVVAGSIGAGVAVQHHGAAHHKSDAPKVAAPAPGRSRANGVRSTPSHLLADVDHSSRSAGETSSRRHDRHRGGSGDGGHHQEAESRTDDRHRHRGHGDEGGDGEHLSVVSSAPLLADEDDHQGTSDDSGRSGNSGRGGTGEGGNSGPSHGDSGSGSGSHSSGSKHGGHGSDDAPAEVVGTVPAAPSTSGGSNSSGGFGSSGGGEAESSGGSGSSDGGSDTDTSSPPTSGSGSSGGPPTSSLGSTTSDDDSHSGGGPGPSGESEISP
jgi:RNA polymerase sigma factor (sigma-70 family)